jgi:hypothetical protein
MASGIIDLTINSVVSAIAVGQLNLEVRTYLAPNLHHKAIGASELCPNFEVAYTPWLFSMEIMSILNIATK